MSRANPLPVKFDETLRRWSLIAPGETCVVAVSGGVDSMVLLHLLLHLKRHETKRPKLVVAHFNHGLRKNSVREESFVRETCRAWKVPCHVGRARKKIESNVESRARELRYGFLEKTARRVKARTILTAHHADDQVETFLIRWIQGAGLKGLSGISLMRPWGLGVSLVRPLLFCSRADIEAYARSLKIPHVVDESNASAKFLRNRVRRLVKGLKKENPNLPERASVNAIFLKSDEEFLDGVAGDAFERLTVRKRSSCAMPIGDYRRLKSALRFRLLQRMCRWVRGEDHAALPASSILKIDEILNAPRGSAVYALPSGLEFRKGGGKMEILRLKSRGKAVAPRKSAC